MFRGGKYVKRKAIKGKQTFLEIFVKNVSLLGKIVKSLPDRTKCFQCLSYQMEESLQLTVKWKVKSRMAVK